MPENHKKKLETFGGTVIRYFYDRTYMLTDLNPKAIEAVYGWYITIVKSRFQGKPIAFDIFYDTNVEGNDYTLWYGFSVANKLMLNKLVKAGKQFISDKPERYTSEVMKKDLGKLFCEECEKNEHYYGIYTGETLPMNPNKQKPFINKIYKFYWQVMDELHVQNLSSQELKDRIQRSILARQGQPEFRKELLHRFNNKCCVTGCQIENILEAAHIQTVKGKDYHHVTNGLLFRSDIHTLFDLNILLIDPKKLTVSISPELEMSDEYKNLQGKKIGGLNILKINKKGLRERWKEKSW